MTFLELCKRVRQECGISGTGPSTVASQTGELKRIVDWTASAYIDLQNSRLWNWLWAETTQLLVAGGRVYSPVTDWVVFPLAWSTEAFSLYLTATGVADEQRLQYLEWNQFKWIPGYGYGTVTTGRPTIFSIKPNRDVTFNTTLDAAYTLRGEYWGTPETLTLDADVPALPEQYHMAIVWKAVMSYAQFEEAGTLMELAERNYRRYSANMARTERPAMVTPGGMV